jgi:hypothetical protein
MFATTQMVKYVNKMNKILKLLVIISGLFTFSLFKPSNAHAAFKFVGWGDSRDNPSVLSNQSNMVKAMGPAFTLFSGDLCGSWSTSCATAWVGFVNGGSNNGIGNITFPVRGNHDSGATATAWGSYFNIAQIASRVGVTNLSQLTTNMTYSFDYQNSHFIGIDMPGGDVSSMSSAQITWMDNDLRAAEARGVKMSFLFWHGPLYYMDDHASTAPSALITVLNNHPTVAAVYNGHEHILSTVELTRTRIPGLTNHNIAAVVDGTSGAPHYSCSSGRSDFCRAVDGFAMTEVLSDTQFKISLYALGNTTPIYTRTYTMGGSGGPTPGPTTPTPAPRTPSPAPRTPTPGTIPIATVDVNSDRSINIIDIGIIVDNYARRPILNLRADINRDGNVDIVDIGIVVDHYGRTY